MARWQPEGAGGGSWSPLASGLPEQTSSSTGVYALAWGPDGALYAGGRFAPLYEGGARNIARWTPGGPDGGQWSTLPSGPTAAASASVRALLWAPDGTLYAAGFFSPSWSGEPGHLAQWRPQGDGGTWRVIDGVLGQGGQAGIHSLAWGPDDALYVGGSFRGAESETTLHNLARWTPSGSSGGSWSSVGDGVDGVVRTVRWGPDNALYVGGEFNAAGTVAGLNRIAQWRPGGGPDDWLPLGGGLDAPVIALYWDDEGYLFAGGAFTGSALNEGLDRIARLEPTDDGAGRWRPLTEGFRGGIEALTWGPDGAVYVGGRFTSVRGLPGTGLIARWAPDDAGGTWQALRDGLLGVTEGLLTPPSVYAMAWGPDGALYVGGRFFSAEGQPNLSHLARWTPDGAGGGSWSSLGTRISGGSNTSVQALAWGPDGALYVGGSFTSAGGLNDLNNIARWTPGPGGSGTWTPLGDGVDRPVRALSWGPDGALYVGGDFVTAGRQPATRMARWTPDGPTGGAWSALASMVNSTVRALAWGPDGALYVGGRFTVIDNQIDFNAIARWRPDAAGGGTWSRLGGGLTGTSAPAVNTLLWGPDDVLYVGGSFIRAGPIIGRNHVARWHPATGDEGAWSGLENGVNAPVHVLLWGQDDLLFVGGEFRRAGAFPSPPIARWMPALQRCRAVASGRWSEPATWRGCTAALPHPTDTALIGLGFDVTADAPAAIGTLRINGALTVRSALRVSEHLALYGALRVEPEGELRLTSGGAEDGYAIASYTRHGGTLTGELTYERFFDGPEGWRLLGSPFSGVRFATLHPDFHTQGAPGTALPDAPPILFHYDPSASEAHRWRPVASYDDPIPSGTGYLFRMLAGSDAGTHLPGRWTIRGDEPDEPVSPSLTDAKDSPFHFVANPFAGPLDWHAVLDAAAGVAPAFYVWDPSRGDTGAFRLYLRTGPEAGVGDASRFLPPFQAYFVTSNATTPSLPLDPTMKAIGASPVVLPQPDAGAEALVALDVQGEGLAAPPLYVLGSHTATPPSARWIAPLSTDALSAFFAVGGAAKLVAGARLDQAPLELDLAITTTRAGSYTLRWPEIAGVPAAWHLTLVDRDAETTVDLRLTDRYTFTLGAHQPPGEALVPGDPAAAPSTAAPRFALRLSPPEADPDPPDDPPVAFAFEPAYPNPLRSSATLAFSLPEAGPVRLSVYDVLGREVAIVLDRPHEAGRHVVEWTATGLASGIYVLRLTGGGHRAVQRVTLQR